MLWTGIAALVAFLPATGFEAAGDRVSALDWLSGALVATIPLGFLVGLLRSRLAHGEAVSELIARVGQAPGEDRLRAALADALGDPSVALAYWLPESERFVDAAGRPVTVSGPAWTEVELQGRRRRRSRSERREAAQRSGLTLTMELVGLEPTTFWLPARRSPS